MRNLKKILALVLALVMSLSLMSVAGATEFPDSDQISETYAESVDVLTGLKVFQGNKGEFKPKDNITRAEVANIIYRIVTGDVDGASVGIYADYNKFTDVPNTAWFAGCVNYCANAEYIKGRGNGKFDPYGNVTGYEALAMILRAIGYDKNGEFTGANWQIQTAATARNRGITKNIVEGTLGVAASREMVAEILCQTILVPVADYSLAFGYRTTDAVTGKENETLAKKTFKMEKWEGVVLANEYADLEHANSTLAAGKTKLGDRTLNVGSEISDIGESRYVYVIPQSGSSTYDLVSSKVYNTGDNQVYEAKGAEVKSGDFTSTLKDAGLSVDASTLHYVNYDEATTRDSDHRIQYVINLTKLVKVVGESYRYLIVNADNDTTLDVVDLNKGSTMTGSEWKALFASGVAPHPAAENDDIIYIKEILPKTDFTTLDETLIKFIFDHANLLGSAVKFEELGEVYVNTQSKEDISDKISLDQFYASYTNVNEHDTTVNSNGLGDDLKVIDNDNDGIAEYVLQTVYSIDIVSAVSDSKVTLNVANNGLCNTNKDLANKTTGSITRWGEGELNVGDVVVYAKIDGKLFAQVAEGETVKINTVNRSAKTATTVNDATYTESAVHTHSDGTLASGVEKLATNTTYNLYFDLYGNLAAFTEGTASQFVLLTDGWYNNTTTASQYAVRAYIDGQQQVVDITGGGDLFIRGRYDSGVNTNSWGNLRELNLGGERLNGNNGNPVNNVTTMVAALEDGVLTPVEQSYYYRQQPRMIDMVDNKIPNRAGVKGDVYTTVINNANHTAYNTIEKDAQGNDLTNVDVRALSTTTFYYVYNAQSNLQQGSTGALTTVVRQYTGYDNLPNISPEFIEDVYAVGLRATTASNGRYYTASVVVIELTNDYNWKQNDSEQVFITDFPEVTQGVRIENVPVIRGNGKTDKVTIDLTGSDIRYYVPAGSTVQTGMPGLYYMWESDRNPGMFYVRAMTNEDISKSDRYYVGTVNKDTATGADNWSSIDTWTYNGGANATGWDAAGKLTFVGAERSALNIAANAENYYTLKYNDRDFATLTPSNRATVLNQNVDTTVVDYTNDLRNESFLGSLATPPLADQWIKADGNTLPQLQRNEVLIAYNRASNGNEEIVYAISFNEYSNTTTRARDFAQRVWLNCLPDGSSESIAPKVVLELPNGEKVELNPNTVTEIPYETWNSLAKAGGPKSGIAYIQAATNTTIAVNNNNFTSNTETAVIDESEGKLSFTVAVRNAAGVITPYTYTVKFLDPAGAAGLDDKNGNALKPSVNGNLIDGIPAGWSVTDYLNNFAATNNGSLRWTFKTGKGTEYVITVDKDGVIGGDYNKMVNTDSVNASEIINITVAVINEDGSSTLTYGNVESNNLGTARAAAKKAMRDFVSYARTNNSWDSWYIEATGIGDSSTHNYAAVNLSEDLVANDKTLNDRIAKIEKLIDSANTVAEVERIFKYNSATSPKYTSMGYDSTADNELTQIFGKSGELKASIQNAFNALNRKQNAINEIDRVYKALSATEQALAKPVYDKAVADIKAVTGDTSILSPVGGGDVIPDAVATEVFKIYTKANADIGAAKAPALISDASIAAANDETVMRNYFSTQTVPADTPAANTSILTYLTTGLTVTQSGTTITVTGHIPTGKSLAATDATSVVPWFGTPTQIMTNESSKLSGAQKLAFVALPVLDDTGAVVECNVIVIGYNGTTTLRDNGTYSLVYAMDGTTAKTYNYTIHWDLTWA